MYVYLRILCIRYLHVFKFILIVCVHFYLVFDFNFKKLIMKDLIIIIHQWENLGVVRKVLPHYIIY